MKRKTISIGVLILALGIWPVNAFSYTHVADTDIQFWITHALNNDPRIDSNGIQIAVTDGIVKLSGTAKDLAAKTFAALEAKKIRGVKGVVNQLFVTPEARSDVDIIQDIRDRISHDSAIESKGIEVSAAKGYVVLDGEVDSWSEKEEAGLIASEVRGVTGVNNQLVIRYKHTQPDEIIQKDILAKLDRDVYLTGLPIQVTVRGGIVTLVGTVGSAFEKERCEQQIRWIEGIRMINNNLVVQASENYGTREKKPVVSDADLRKTIRAEVAKDIRLDDTNIEIDVKKGFVTVVGSVPTHRQARIAAEDINNVIGVGWVRNDLMVTGAHLDDLSIFDAVVSNFRSDTALWDKHIETHVKNGEVTISGKVDTSFEKAHAAEVASRVKGVRNVINNLKVEWRLDISNKAVTERIRQAFERDEVLFPVADLISIDVKSGIVTLSGSVDSWRQHEEAERVATDAYGVMAVLNRLSVTGFDYQWDRADGARSSFFDSDLYEFPEQEQ